ncbi:MAG: succinate dehydrogenase, hydrophobic membrane anchor protein [Gammaproteobacteria bacterium]|nr:succinate dehydrogenase, hydrophobic membrane anchor protein [Pseudomonadales bacterium]MCP5346272.1 succinate dehydrogenase, hydrophobic membrane anchor protein [Pseudomonadales bacterium]
MVTNVSSFGRSGLFDWVVQRVSAVILASYTLCILSTLLLNPDMTYPEWQLVFDSFSMRFFTLLTLLAILAHGWIGMWTISTDYLTTRMMGGKGTVLRIGFQLLCIGLTLLYLVWGIDILWGN